MSVVDRGYLLRAIRDIPQDQRADVINQAQPFLSKEMSVEDMKNCLLVTRYIPKPKERGLSISHYLLY